MVNDNKLAVALIESFIVPRCNLPEHIFRKRFLKYFFFDNDICTSSDLIESTKAIVHESLGNNISAYVYSSSDHNFLGNLYGSDNWTARLAALTAKMNDDRDYGGLVIISTDKSWGIFQKTPVDEGVLGINTNNNLSLINELIYENFIDFKIIKTWLKEENQQDANLVQGLGREYLRALINNYS